MKTELSKDTQTNTYRKFICILCLHIYDEEIGDPDNGIAAKTKWEDIPEDWCCPDCGATKEDFEEMK